MVDTKTLQELTELSVVVRDKLCTLSDDQCMVVAHKAGLAASQFIRPVCDYLPDYLVDKASKGWKVYPDLAFMNLKNLKKAIRLAGFN